MEKHIITERVMDVIRKVIEIKYEEVIHSSENIIEKKIDLGIIDDFTCHYNYPINNNLCLYINIYPVEHKKMCEYYIKDANTENIIDTCCDKCHRVYGYKLFFILHYNNDGLNIFLENFGMRTRYKKGKDIINHSWKDCINEMERFITVSPHFFCKCGELCSHANGKRYDMCANCYIHSYIRKEDCCVCLEDGNCWVQLGCNHIIHTHCWNKIVKQGPSCPLCRASTSVEIMNPYN